MADCICDAHLGENYDPYGSSAVSARMVLGLIVFTCTYELGYKTGFSFYYREALFIFMQALPDLLPSRTLFLCLTLTLMILLLQLTT